MGTRTKKYLLFAAGMAVAIGLDQWTKYLAVIALKGEEAMIIIKGVFEFLYSENRGAAFGMFQGKQIFFAVVALIVIIAAAYILFKMPDDRKYIPLEMCILLISSGAVGNMIDRLANGYVVDFLYFSLINFPIFNVADCYVTIGTAILIALLMFYYEEEELEIFSFKKKGESE